MPTLLAALEIMTVQDPHRPVMVERTLDLLLPRGGRGEGGGIYLDATVGYGGHAEALLEAGDPDLTLVGMDRDAEALDFTRTRLSRFGGRVTLVKENFSNLSTALDNLGIDRIDGALFDLGMSSPQVDEAERGFGWTHPGPLDMRMDRDQDTTAANLVNDLSAVDLQEIFETFGEERFSKRIAQSIVRVRRTSPIRTTDELASIVASAVPSRFWPPRRHPATRTFQALRIAVNHELDVLPAALEDAISRLRPGGRIAVLAYHSLEDRQVKQTFRRLATGIGDLDRSPLGEPGGGGPRLLDILTKRPLRPSEFEIGENPRSRSALLRSAERREQP